MKDLRSDISSLERGSIIVGFKMCDCACLLPFPYEFGIRSRRLGFCRSRSTSTTRRHDHSVILRHSNPATDRKVGGIRALSGRYRDDFKPRRSRSSSAGTSKNSDRSEARKHVSLEGLAGMGSSSVNGLDPEMASVSGDEREMVGDGAPAASTFDFLELKRELEEEESSTGCSEDDELVPMGSNSSDSEEGEGLIGRRKPRGERQVMRRLSLLAKQVISIQSARSLGFVSQLWVDTRSWVVVLIEVRPNLLSGEIEKFLLEDVSQVGDVVLVQDGSVMENEHKMIGLDTLVGYNVVTSNRHNVGKVRGYSFNVNSGAIESLELDSFGISIIPASLVNTYCLLVEDVLDVISDTVVVHEGAISRLQRLTKGIWNTQNVDISGDDLGEYSDYERQRVQPSRSQRNQKNFSGRKFHRRMRVIEDDWELPMDY